MEDITYKLKIELNQEETDIFLNMLQIGAGEIGNPVNNIYSKDSKKTCLAIKAEIVSELQSQNYGNH